MDGRRLLPENSLRLRSNSCISRTAPSGMSSRRRERHVPPYHSDDNNNNSLPGPDPRYRQLPVRAHHVGELRPREPAQRERVPELRRVLLGLCRRFHPDSDPHRRRCRCRDRGGVPEQRRTRVCGRPHVLSAVRRREVRPARRRVRGVRRCGSRRMRRRRRRGRHIFSCAGVPDCKPLEQPFFECTIQSASVPGPGDSVRSAVLSIRLGC